jgi:hypothetical protein
VLVEQVPVAAPARVAEVVPAPHAVEHDGDLLPDHRSVVGGEAVAVVDERRPGDPPVLVEAVCFEPVGVDLSLQEHRRGEPRSVVLDGVEGDEGEPEHPIVVDQVALLTVERDRRQRAVVQQFVDTLERRDDTQREGDRAGFGQVAAIHPPLQVDHGGLRGVEFGNGNPVLEPGCAVGPCDRPHQLGARWGGPAQLHPEPWIPALRPIAAEHSRAGSQCMLDH